MRRMLPWLLIVVFSLFSACGPATPATPSTPADERGANEDTGRILWLPGLNTGGVKVPLERLGFRCTAFTSGPVRRDAQGPTLRSGTCRQERVDLRFDVSFMGQDADHLRYITAGAWPVTSPSERQAAREFLAFMATLPYDDGSPGEARQWVVDTFPQLGTLVIGSARFELWGERTAPHLSIAARDAP